MAFRMWTDPVDFFLTSSFAFIFLAIIVVYRIGWDFWSEISMPSDSKSDSASRRPNTPASAPGRIDGNVEMHPVLLTPSTYDRLIPDAPKGQFSILLCTTASPLGQRLTDQFYHICRRFRCVYQPFEGIYVNPSFF